MKKITELLGVWRDAAHGRKNNLDFYREIFSAMFNGDSNEGRIEISIEADPLDQISKVRILVPSKLRGQNGKARLLQISGKNSHNAPISIELTGLKLDRGGGWLSIERDRNCTHVFYEPEGEQKEDLIIEFLAWELMGQTLGMHPFNSSTISLEIAFGDQLQASACILKVITRAEVRPMSTQGNHLLAYPSRTHKDSRMQPLYFGDHKKIVASVVLGLAKGGEQPWGTLFRSGLSALFVYFVIAYTEGSESPERWLLALLAALIAGAQVTWEIAKEISVFSIYSKVSRLITHALLAFNTVFIVLLFLSVLYIIDPGLNDAQWLKPLILVYAAVGLGSAIFGFTAYSMGGFLGYKCDYNGCSRRLGIKRAFSKECRYTGRVFCTEHVRENCQICPHGVDLASGEIRSLAGYQTDSPVCLKSWES